MMARKTEKIKTRWGAEIQRLWSEMESVVYLMYGPAFSAVGERQDSWILVTVTKEREERKRVKESDFSAGLTVDKESDIVIQLYYTQPFSVLHSRFCTICQTVLLLYLSKPVGKFEPYTSL